MTTIIATMLQAEAGLSFTEFTETSSVPPGSLKTGLSP